MFRQYVKFFINGGLLGLIAWGLQILIYRAFAVDSSFLYALASGVTYIPLMIVNFMFQGRWIFNRDGVFVRFIASNVMMMFLVSILSPLCRLAVNFTIGPPYGDWSGFFLASLVSSIPSFFLVRNWAFGEKSHPI